MIAAAEPATLFEVPTSEANAEWETGSPFHTVADPRESWRSATEVLEEAVRRRIAQRTWGRLRQPLVKVGTHRVIVRGSSPTYYLKQLALAAVQEALPGAAVELDIQVMKAESRLAWRSNYRPGLFASSVPCTQQNT